MDNLMIKRMKENKQENIGYLLGKVPRARMDNTLLILTYWRVFDNIDIPSDLANEILEKGTSPETIMRSKRKVIEKVREIGCFEKDFDKNNTFKG
jgi:hypothetical protein